MYTFGVQNEVGKVRLNLEHALEISYSLYRKQAWWYKLITIGNNFNIRMSKMFVKLFPNKQITY